MSGCSRWNFADGLPETSNCYCHPGIAGGSPAYARTVWDVHQLDQYFDELSTPKDNPWDELRQLDPTVVTLRLRFVVADRDRHGNVRYYFRRGGEMKVRLHGLPGSKEFMDVYQKALSGLEKSTAAGRPDKPGSFGHVCSLYYSSAVVWKLNVKTQIWRRRVLDETVVNVLTFQLIKCGRRMSVSYGIRRRNAGPAAATNTESRFGLRR